MRGRKDISIDINALRAIKNIKFKQFLNSILKQLEKNVGIGNFDFISEETTYKYLKDDDDDMRLKEFRGMTFEDK